jgi:DUF4097 and DUF4098 domain-containing protein YvlB
MRLRFSLVAVALTASVASAPAQESAPRIGDRVARAVSRVYQGRSGPEQIERFSRRIKIARDGRFSISNIAGDVLITGGSGDEVSIEAVKRARGSSSSLASVRIDVDARPGRIDVRTTHTASNDRVAVDYTIMVPAGVSVEARSVSGDVTVRSVQGSVRAETVSGNVATSATTRIELAKSVSGNVDLTDGGTDGDLSASSVSGEIRARGLKAHGIDLRTVSGDMQLVDVTCDRLGAQSVSGGVEFTGTLAKSGRYDLNSHSGTIRLTLSGTTGFELTGATFSGSIRSGLPLTIGGTAERSPGDAVTRPRGRNDRALQATSGDGSAVLAIHTFSGDIIIAKR